MKQAKTLSPAELKRVLAVASADRHAERNKLAILLSFYAGLRVKEIAALTIGDVFTKTGEVKSFIHLTAAQTKGKEGRTIVLGTKLIDAMRTYYILANLKQQQEVTKPLLRSQKGTAFSANSLCQLFAHLYAAAGLEGASSHSGRRTFITNLSQKGVNAKVLMTLAGHKNLSTTQRYIDVNDAMLAQAVELA
jgi:integrase/recombinase XerD